MAETAPAPRSIVDMIRAGTLDAGLSATLWMLIEARIPLIVAAGSEGDGKSTLLDALLVFLPVDVRRIHLAGSGETFDWLPQASELGWPGTMRTTGDAPVRPGSTVLIARELSDRQPGCTWGERARIAVRATSIGYGLATTMNADSLVEAFDSLSRPPVALTTDELSYLGCVVILRRLDDGRRRVTAAHYVRPILNDVHGHTQRMAPALLATWEPDQDRFEHFGWGITPELAFRVGQRSGDFELEAERRRAFLDGLVVAGVAGVDDVRSALGRFLVGRTGDAW